MAKNSNKKLNRIKKSSKPNLAPKISKTILAEIFSPQMSRSEQSKLKIIETTIATFAESSEDLLNYEEIARKGKINRSLVNYYFPTKDELFLTAIKYVRARHQELAVDEMKKAQSPSDVIKKYVDATFRWIEETPAHVKTWILFWFLASSKPELRTVHSSLTKMGEIRIIAILKDLDGKSLSHSDLSYLAKAIQRIITGAVIEAMSESSTSRDQLREAALKQSLDLLKIYGFNL